MSEADDSSKTSHPDGQQRPPNLPRVLQFMQLAEGKNELLIEHKGQTYLLRATKNGKLLLNK